MCVGGGGTWQTLAELRCLGGAVAWLPQSGQPRHGATSLSWQRDGNVLLNAIAALLRTAAEDMRGASKINKKIEEKKAISDALSQPS